MMQRVKRWFAMLAMVLVCVATAGCFRVASDLTVNSDGSAKMAYTVTSMDIIRDYVEEIKDKALKDDPTVKVTPVTKDYSGYKIEGSYDSLETLAKKSGTTFAAVDGLNQGIQRHKGFLFDAYSFDLNLNGENNHKSGSGGNSNDGLAFDFTIHLPSAAISQNADRVSQDGKTLYWNQTGVLTGGGAKSMKVTFRLWHTAHVAILAVLAVAGAGAAVMGYTKMKALPEERNKWMPVAAIGAVVFVVIAGYSAVTASGTGTFTDTDIISPRYTAAGTLVKPNQGQSTAQPAQQAASGQKALGKKATSSAAK